VYRHQFHENVARANRAFRITDRVERDGQVVHRRHDPRRHELDEIELDRARLQQLIGGIEQELLLTASESDEEAQHHGADVDDRVQDRVLGCAAYKLQLLKNVLHLVWRIAQLGKRRVARRSIQRLGQEVLDLYQDA